MNIGYTYYKGKRFMWTENEIDELIRLYPNMMNIDIANKLGKTKNAINNKGCYLKLKKTKKHLTNISEEANKIRVENGGRDLKFNLLKEIALKYKTKIDFNRGDNSAYNTARLSGVLGEICQHMTVMKFSIPQLILRNILDGLINIESSYNDRSIISPYEIDIYYNKYKLGFEYQGLYWHNNNTNDIIKNKLMLEKNITIIYINEITRDYEVDIKNQLIDNLDKINKVTKLSLSGDEILSYEIDMTNIYETLYNKKELIEIAGGYEDFKIFKKEKLNIYRKLLKLDLIEVATSHMVNKIKKIKLDDDEILGVVSKYSDLSTFRLNELKLYKHIKRTNKDYLIKNLKRRKSFTLEDIKLKISEHTYKCNFIRDNKKMYKYIRTNHLTYLLNGLIDCRRVKITS